MARNKKSPSSRRGLRAAPEFFKTSVALRLRVPISPKNLRDVLEMVDVKATLSELKEWTPRMRAEAEDWAVRTHFRASDNVTVRVPQRPKFLPVRVPLVPKGTPTGTLYDLIR